MNEATALARLKLFTQWTVEPGLTTDELGVLLAMNRGVDADDLGPADEGYIATWTMQGLYRAAAEGWRWKAAKFTPQHAVTVDNQIFSAGQKFDHCEQMARHYAKLIFGSPSVANPPALTASDVFFG